MSLIAGWKLTVIALFDFVFEGNFQVQASGLGEAYTWSGLFWQFYAIHNMSFLKRRWHISNLKCKKLIRVEYSVRKGIRVTFDHWFNCIAYSLLSFNPWFQHLGRGMNKLRTTTKLHAHRVQLDLQIFHPSHLYHAYPLLPRKALGKRHLVFLDLEFSKKHENNYQDCPTCDSCLPNAFQWKTPNKWENMASISHSVLQTVWIVAKAQKSSNWAWTISQIRTDCLLQCYYR